MALSKLQRLLQSVKFVANVGPRGSITRIRSAGAVASLGVPLVVDGENAVGVWVVISLTKVDRDTTASTAAVLLKIMDQRQDVTSRQSSGVTLQKGALARACQILHTGNQLASVVPTILRDLRDIVGDVF